MKSLVILVALMAGGELPLDLKADSPVTQLRVLEHERIVLEQPIQLEEGEKIVAHWYRTSRTGASYLAVNDGKQICMWGPPTKANEPHTMWVGVSIALHKYNDDGQLIDISYRQAEHTWLIDITPRGPPPVDPGQPPVEPPVDPDPVDPTQVSAMVYYDNASGGAPGQVHKARDMLEKDGYTFYVVDTDVREYDGSVPEHLKKMVESAKGFQTPSLSVEIPTNVGTWALPDTAQGIYDAVVKQSKKLNTPQDN